MPFTSTLDKARLEPTRVEPIKGYTLAGSNLARKYESRVEVNALANTLAYYDTATITVNVL
jgi:hypothetical protein